MGENNINDVKRGGCLTTFLVIFIVLMGSVTILDIVSGDPNLKIWIRIVFDILYVGVIAGCIGMFRWRRWGVYAFLGCYVALYFMNLFTIKGGLELTNILSRTASVIIVFGILFILIKSSWKDMK